MERLLNRKIRPLSPLQLHNFADGLHAKPALPFNSDSVAKLLAVKAQTVIGIDIGGSKLSFVELLIKNGVAYLDGFSILPSQEGEEYLEQLESVKERVGSTPVGISSTGQLKGTIMRRGNNVPIFKNELDQKYKGDLAKLFPNSVVLNDGTAVTIGALYNLAFSGKLHPDEISGAISFIGGTGTGASAWAENQIWTSEPGDVAIHPQLQQHLNLPQTDSLQVRSIASGKAMATRWLQKKGEKLGGAEIATLAQSGDEFALDVVDDSAYVSAHVIYGLGRRFRLFEKQEDTLVFCHGGVFNIPGYGARINQHLIEYLGPSSPVFVAESYKENLVLGLKGAALAALSGYVA